MAATNNVIMERLSDSRQFRFRAVGSFVPRKSQPALVIPLVNTSAANALLFRMFGQSETITFTFALFDDDTDVANGTYILPVKTVVEQEVYLKDVFYSAEWDLSWTVWDSRSIYDSGTPATVVITSVEFDNKTSPDLVTGTIALQRGNNGDLE
jgi:hypothetical protein